MDRVIQIVTVQFTHGDVDLSSKLRSKRLPVLLEYESEVVFLPMIDDRLVDHTGFGIPQGNRLSICAPRTICGVPCTPLLTRHRPTVSGTHDVFHLTFMTDRKLNVSVEVTLARAFRTSLVKVGILVPIDIDELEAAKIDTIGT